MSPKIVVVGSCMLDFVGFSPRLPKCGETIKGSKFIQTFGGKGANQCVAAAKLGGVTSLVAKLGEDHWADLYFNHLKELNVNTTHVEKIANISSGIAQIVVAENGDNQIVIIPGANDHLDETDIEKAATIIQEASVVVTQLETSQEVAKKTLELAKGISILNGAPAIADFDPELIKLPTIFCVNETEAEIFTGLVIKNMKDAEIAAKELISTGCKSVILTLGSQGALYLDRNSDIVYVSAPSVKAVDSTGAGDAFIGALAYLLANCSDYPIAKLIEFACKLASDSVTRLGTQISFPDNSVLKKIIND